jgi:serine/threonine protein kinase
VDFGISKLDRGTLSERLTRRGTVLGSAYYMSPEQAQASDAVDQRADLYSVGALLFEMLAGRPPHLGPTLESVLVAICTQRAPSVATFRPDVPTPLGRTIARSLEREPDARFANASVMLAALEARGEATTERPHRRRSSRTLAAGALAALVGFALTAALIATRSRSENAMPSPQGPAAAERLPPEPVSAVVTRTLAAPLPSSVPAGTVTAVSVAPVPSAPSPRAPRKPASERKHHAEGTTSDNTGVAPSLHLSTREP